MDDTFMQAIAEAIAKKDMAWLASQAVVELHRIANAQEAIVKMADADLEAQIEEAIKSRAEERAEELVADQTKRTFIGRKNP